MKLYSNHRLMHWLDAYIFLYAPVPGFYGYWLLIFDNSLVDSVVKDFLAD